MPLFPIRSHGWEITPREGRAIQEQLAGLVILAPLDREIRLVAGADTSYDLGSDRVAGAVVVWDLLREQVVEQQSAVVTVPFPYIPGLLTFREAPALLPAFARLSVRPDLLMFNGHGISHPRRLGLAAHLGVLFDLPAIGIAQKPLAGVCGPVGDAPGDAAPVRIGAEVVGLALRTRRRANPLFVSPGHRTTVADARRLTLATTGNYKLPAPIRLAHLLCNEVRKALPRQHPTHREKSA